MPNPRHLACYLDPLSPVAAWTPGGLGPKEGHRQRSEPSRQLPWHHGAMMSSAVGPGSWDTLSVLSRVPQT